MKRSPIQRRTPLRATAPAKASVPLLKMRKCAICKEAFRPFSSMVKWCSPECGTAIGLQKLADQKAREHKAKLADSKPLAHWLKLTETVVNAYIRQRDAGQPCISCGTQETAAWQAGHFLSIGARPELRFELDNIHLQCLRCNVHLSGNQAEYCRRLPEKLGRERVEWLLGPHPAAKFTREGLAQMRKDIAALTRQLRKHT